jgi:hypothetical protein
VDHLRFGLRSIFELALSEGVVDRNPAATLFTPRNGRAGRERLVLNPDQAVAMIAALDIGEKVIASGDLGGNASREILALQLGDLDGDSLWVRRRLYKGDLDVPKTRRSSRQAALTTATLELLKAWPLRFLESRPDAWLFPSENRLPLRRDNLWRRYILSKLKPVGLQWATFQVVRRTFATLPVANGQALEHLSVRGYPASGRGSSYKQSRHCRRRPERVRTDASCGPRRSVVTSVEQHAVPSLR